MYYRICYFRLCVCGFIDGIIYERVGYSMLERGVGDYYDTLSHGEQYLELVYPEVTSN